MREPSRAEAAKVKHTCGLVDVRLIVRMVKMENNPLFRNQRVNIVLGGASISCSVSVFKRSWKKNHIYRAAKATAAGRTGHVCH